MVLKIVLTGGPCAGKTSCLRALRAHFGERIAAVPEASTLLLDSGLPPPGHASIHCTLDAWIREYQTAILGTQRMLEETLERLARDCRIRLIVCDRGLLDGAAYFPGGRPAFLGHFGLSLDECFARYARVVHLQSLAHSHPPLYGRGNNASRFEDVAEAQRVEQAVLAAWEGHPGRLILTGEAELSAKIARTLEHVETLLSAS